MKVLVMLTLLFSLELLAAGSKLEQGSTNSYKIVDDIRICGPIMNNNFKKLIKNLEKYHKTTLSDSYFNIECKDADLLNLVINSPRERYFTSLHMQMYFEKKEGIPEMFSRILLHEVDGKNALKRIEEQIIMLQNTSLKGTEYEGYLIKLQTKFIAYLKKYPVD